VRGSDPSNNEVGSDGGNRRSSCDCQRCAAELRAFSD
jgi:hypothetical protein